jgi:hypothetical protein
MIVKEDEGLSNHGIIWFAEADTPLGPWVYAQKVVSHENRNFYNPAQRPFFNQDGGRLIYFDGTYVGGSGFFAPNNEVTPYYNYNQIMYRLALDDPRLFLPVPVYQVTSADGLMRYLLREGVESRNEWWNIKEISFFALPPDRRREGLVPVFATMSRRGMILSLESPAKTIHGQPLFYALPAKQEESDQWKKSSDITPLYEYLNADGTHIYSIDSTMRNQQLQPSADPICRVWRNPMSLLILDLEAKPSPATQ